MTKAEIRKMILKARQELTAEEVALASQVICRKVVQTGSYETAENICLYNPIRNEVNVMLLAEIAMEDGKRVWLPRTEGEFMNFYLYSEGDELREGPFKVLEPSSDVRLEPDDKTLVVMPGAVFTEFRDRIGYGGGYYDKYLSAHPCCRTVAVCYDLQIVSEIPTEEHDKKPDLVICETSIYG